MTSQAYERQVWRDGDPSSPLSAARLGLLEDGIFDAHYRSLVRAYDDQTDVVFPNSTAGYVYFDHERFDTDLLHDGHMLAAGVKGSSAIRARTAGYYQITAQLVFNAAAVAAGRVLYIVRNGADVIATAQTTTTAASQFTHLECTTLYYLAMDDMLQVSVIQSTGGSLGYYVGADYTPTLMMVLVSL